MFSAIQTTEYIKYIMETPEFLFTNNILFNYPIVEKAIEKMLAYFYLNDRIPLSLPQSIDFRVFGNSLITWRKGYTIEETASVLKVDPQIIQTIRKEFELEQQTKFDESVEDINSYLKDRASLYSLRRPLNVMMGTTPSGSLHLANILTLAGGTIDVLSAINNAGIHNVRFTLGFNDLLALHRHHSQDDINSRKSDINNFIDEIQRIYGIEILLQPFSELQRTRPFRQILQEVAKRKLFDRYGYSGITLENSVRGERFFYKILDLNNIDFLRKEEVDFVPIYLLDLMALRDASENVDIHILGGDQMHAGRIIDPRRFVGKNSPFMYITGRVYGLNGREMHTTNNNTITIDELQEFPNWLERIIEIKQKAPIKSIGPLEYRDLIPNGRKVYGIF